MMSDFAPEQILFDLSKKQIKVKKYLRVIFHLKINGNVDPSSSS